jgi:hypothetical protein
VAGGLELLRFQVVANRPLDISLKFVERFC